MKHTGTCSVCHKQFTRNRPLRGETCSPNCRGVLRGKKEIRTCTGCGKSFKCVPSYPSRHCSIYCFNKTTGSKAKERPDMIRKCELCGKSYRRAAGAIERRFCSKKCAGAARYGHKQALPDFPTITCKRCGNTKASSKRNQRYCSNSCARRDVSAERKAASRARGIWPNYREAKKYLLERCAACERCGWKELPEVLELHHIDRNRRNNHMSNLKLICPNCHTVEHFMDGTGQFKNNLGRGKHDAATPAAALLLNGQPRNFRLPASGVA